MNAFNRVNISAEHADTINRSTRDNVDLAFGCINSDKTIFSKLIQNYPCFITLSDYDQNC